MEIHITGRNVDMTASVKEYIHKKLDKVEKLYSRIYKCEVIIEEIKEMKIVEVILNLKHHRVVAKESSPDLFASIDNAAESVKKQLTRAHGKVESKRRRNIFSKIMSKVPGFRSDEQEMFYNVPNGEIIKTRVFADKPMLPEEAKLELEIMDRVFLVFKNADTSETNVIYKRNDGNYGLIEPQF
jgi:putative sigma-54 modulation protein